MVKKVKVGHATHNDRHRLWTGIGKNFRIELLRAREEIKQLLAIGKQFVETLTSDGFMKLSRVVVSGFRQSPEMAGATIRNSRVIFTQIVFNRSALRSAWMTNDERWTTHSSNDFGDMLIDSSWRSLSGIEAMAGMLVFGWSSALLLAALLHMLRIINP